jgi:polysaccharide pyruvyl transferase WcaK-like protein
MELMSIAKIIGSRSQSQIDRLQKINSNVHIIPDLVYSLQSKIWKCPKLGNSVLVLPNITVVPQQCDPYWKHAAWAYFKSEFCQFIDWLVESGYNLHLLPMCSANEADDSWIIGELVSHMNKRSSSLILSSDDAGLGIVDIGGLISQHDVVITQRFHGIVLSEMTRTPYIAIHHHDKLKQKDSSTGLFLSYYNSSKHSFVAAFEQAIKMRQTSSLADESAIFIAFSKEVMNLL